MMFNLFIRSNLVLDTSSSYLKLKLWCDPGDKDFLSSVLLNALGVVDLQFVYSCFAWVKNCDFAVAVISLLRGIVLSSVVFWRTLPSSSKFAVCTERAVSP